MCHIRTLLTREQLLGRRKKRLNAVLGKFSGHLRFVIQLLLFVIYELKYFDLGFFFRYQREEAKIQAWVNLQSAKAEAQSRKLEVPLVFLFLTFYNLFAASLCYVV